MDLKLVVAVLVIAATPAFAQQPGGAAPQRPPKSDWQRAVQIIGGDKTKVAQFCEISQVDRQIDEADAKKDTKAVQDLLKKAAELNEKLGADYVVLTSAISTIEPQSPEGKELKGALDPLVKQCKK
jgi:hypothetical protein